MSYMCVVLCWNYCSFNQCVEPFCKPYTWRQELRRISTCCLQKTPVVSNFALIPKKVAIHFVFSMCTGPSLLCPYLFLNNKDLVVDGFLLWLPPLGSSCKMKWLQLIVQWTMRREIVSLPHSQTAHGSMYKWRRNNRLPIAGSTFSDGHDVWKVLSGSSSLLQVEWISFSRSSYIKIFWDEIYRVYKKLLIAKKKS